jgi:hypothetical protein
MAKAAQAPELAGLFSSFQMNVPQLFADLDRTKAGVVQRLVAEAGAVLDLELEAADRAEPVDRRRREHRACRSTASPTRRTRESCSRPSSRSRSAGIRV